MDLVVGAGKLDRTLQGCRGSRRLLPHRRRPALPRLPAAHATGPHGARGPCRHDPDQLTRRGTAFKAVQDHGDEVHLDALPGCALEDSDDGERQAVCDVICTVIAWPGFAASVATKVLHKKRPALIPILDNEAIFGAYMSPTWPEQRASMDSVYSPSRIRKALDWIWLDLTRPENEDVWPALSGSHPARSRIELFDIAWWMHFRSIQPVARPI